MIHRRPQCRHARESKIDDGPGPVAESARDVAACMTGGDCRPRRLAAGCRRREPSAAQEGGQRPLTPAAVQRQKRQSLFCCLAGHGGGGRRAAAAGTQKEEFLVKNVPEAMSTAVVLVHSRRAPTPRHIAEMEDGAEDSPPASPGGLAGAHKGVGVDSWLDASVFRYATTRDIYIIITQRVSR